MHDLVEAIERLRIGEDDFGQRRAIERSTANELRPDMGDGEQTVGLRGYRFTRELIGVNDVRAEFREGASNLALPRSDSTR
jgi:hypothetical protein